MKTTTKVFGIDKLTIYPLLTDNSSGFTVGTGVEIPGAKALEVSLQIEEKNLSGNELILDIYSKVRKLTFNATFAKLGLDIMQGIIDGSLMTTESQGKSFSIQNGKNPSYFKLVAEVEGTDEGTLEIHLMKCKLNAIPIKLSESDFSTFSLSGSGIYTTHKFTRNNVIAELLMDIILEPEAAA